MSTAEPGVGLGAADAGELKSVALTLTLVLVSFVACVAVLVFMALADHRADRAEWRRLAALQPAQPARFDPGMIADLPEPARRYLAYTIRAGTVLLPVAEIAMRGQFGLGTKAQPNYRPIAARQILAAPEGFVWAMHTRGAMPLSGSDSGRWTRFRLFGVIPVARLGGGSDHARSAFGRLVAEAVFWTPAALLPGPHVAWEAVNGTTARVTVRHGALTQAVDVTVDAEGRPVTVVFQRWSDANPDRTYRLQPFGGALSDFREVEGYRLPFHVEAGNMFGTEEYFPFFRVDVTGVKFPKAR